MAESSSRQNGGNAAPPNVKALNRRPLPRPSASSPARRPFWIGGCGGGAIVLLKVAVAMRSFPNHQHSPARGFQFLPGLPVPFDIAGELDLPVFAIGRRHPAVPAIVLVPEAAVDEDHRASRSEDQVRLARQVLAVQPVPVAQAVDQTADDHLGLHALTLDASHVLAAARRGDLVHHYILTFLRTLPTLSACRKKNP